jgi:uncharacterized delta-60 repeat protein
MALVRRKAGALRLASSIAAAALPDRVDPNFGLEALEPRRLLSGSFGDHGWTHADFPADTNGSMWATLLAAGTDGKIYVGGEVWPSGQEMALARFNPDGSPDTTFGSDGSGTVAIPVNQETAVDHILVEPDGKILVTAESSAGLTVVQLNSDGSIDTSFGGGPQLLTMFNGFPPGVDYQDAVWLTTDGDVELMAMNGPNVVTLRLNAEGQPDTAFAPNGYVSSLLDANGNPIGVDNLLAAEPTANGGVVGYADLWSANATVQLVQVQLDDSGNILSQKVVDTGLTPGSDFSQYTPDYYLTLNPDGSAFVCSAAADPQVAKLTPDGDLDQSFGVGGLATLPGSYAMVLAVAPTGGPLVEFGPNDPFFTGSTNAVDQLNPDGSIDTAFNGGQPAGSTAFPALVLADGSTVFSYFSDQASFVLEEIAPGGQENFNTSDAAALAVIANANSWSSSTTADDGLFAAVDGATIWNPDGTQSVFDDGGAVT